MKPARLILQVNSEALRKACPIPFHEGRLWKSADGADLRRQLQVHFRNMTSIMDCVGCEKCKMWGKLQLLGAPPQHSPVARLSAILHEPMHHAMTVAS